MAGGWKSWTTFERNRIARLRLEGKTLQEIADELPGRSRKAISNVIARYGLPPQTRPRRSPKPSAPAPEVAASEALRDATLAALTRFANDNAMTEQEARVTLMGRETRGNVTRIRPSAIDLSGHSPFEVISGRFKPENKDRATPMNAQTVL